MIVTNLILKYIRALISSDLFYIKTIDNRIDIFLTKTIIVQINSVIEHNVLNNVNGKVKRAVLTNIPSFSKYFKLISRIFRLIFRNVYK